MVKVHFFGRIHGNSCLPLMIWKAYTQSSLNYRKTDYKQLRIIGSQLKKGNHGENGKSTELTFRLGRKLTFYRGRTACNTGRFHAKKERMCLDGVTPPLASSQSKKLIIYRVIL